MQEERWTREHRARRRKAIQRAKERSESQRHCNLNLLILILIYTVSRLYSQSYCLRISESSCQMSLSQCFCEAMTLKHHDLACQRIASRDIYDCHNWEVLETSREQRPGRPADGHPPLPRTAVHGVKTRSSLTKWLHALPSFIWVIWPIKFTNELS